MNNKKYLIIAIVIIILVAIGFGIYSIASSYLFEKGKGIPNTEAEITNRILSIENVEERSNQIDFLVSQNVISQEYANELY